MSKAEERALEAYPVLFSERYGYDNTFKDRRESYIKGYHQAEKDLELTWEDIEKLCLIAREVHQFRGFWSESAYQEVLKRFKAQKGE